MPMVILQSLTACPNRQVHLSRIANHGHTHTVQPMPTPWKIPARRAACFVIRYSILSPCPQNSLCRASTPIAAHGNHGAGYKVTACQALHLTRYVWHILPQQLTLLASVAISRDRLNLHHPFSRRSVHRAAVRFGSAPRRSAKQA